MAAENEEEAEEDDIAEDEKEAVEGNGTAEAGIAGQRSLSGAARLVDVRVGRAKFAANVTDGRRSMSSPFPSLPSGCPPALLVSLCFPRSVPAPEAGCTEDSDEDNDGTDNDNSEEEEWEGVALNDDGAAFRGRGTSSVMYDVLADA